MLLLTSIYVLRHREIGIFLYLVWFTLKYFTSVSPIHNQIHLAAHGDFVTHSCAVCPFYSDTVAVTGFFDGVEARLKGHIQEINKLI
jgi:hypothetical protein